MLEKELATTATASYLVDKGDVACSTDCRAIAAMRAKINSFEALILVVTKACSRLEATIRLQCHIVIVKKFPRECVSDDLTFYVEEILVDTYYSIGIITNRLTC